MTPVAFFSSTESLPVPWASWVLCSSTYKQKLGAGPEGKAKYCLRVDNMFQIME